jgi:O-antigen/teichoic acid export membrane protein
VLTWVFILVAIENVVANFILIPWLSLNGAALSTSISEFLLAAIFVVFAQRTVGRLDWARVATGPVIASALSAAVMVAADELSIAVIGGAVVYLAALVLVERVLFPDDARAVLDLLPGR